MSPIGATRAVMFGAGADEGTASLSSFDVSTNSPGPQGLDFSPDGTKMFVASFTDGTVTRYTLSTPWDVTTASFDTGQSFTATGTYGTLRSVRFKPDGTEMFTLHSTATVGYVQWTLSTAWDVTTATFTDYFNPSGAHTYGHTLSPNGQRMWVIIDYGSGWGLFEYEILTPYDLTTIRYDAVNILGLGSVSNPIHGVDISNDGFHFYLAFEDEILVYETTSPFSLTGFNITAVETIDVSSELTGTRDVVLGELDTPMYITGGATGEVYQYTRSTGNPVEFLPTWGTPVEGTMDDGTSAPLTLAVPDHEEDDLLVVFLSYYATDAISAVSSSGWTKLGNINTNGSTNLHMASLYKVAGASEPSTVDFIRIGGGATDRSACGVMVAVKGTWSSYGGHTASRSSGTRSSMNFICQAGKGDPVDDMSYKLFAGTIDDTTDRDTTGSEDCYTMVDAFSTAGSGGANLWAGYHEAKEAASTNPTNWGFSGTAVHTATNIIHIIP